MLKLKDEPFKYGELARITGNFGMVLVEGGSGNIYFGTLEDGTEVAVKVFFCFSIRGSREFQAKAKHLRAVHHENLVSLLGYCDGTKTKGLIYEFMDGGNLQQNLTGDIPNFLTWSKRLQIAVDVAQGLYMKYPLLQFLLWHGLRSFYKELQVWIIMIANHPSSMET
ncbi:probable LRR receptor-like serine/threonine-protein kinase At4g29180 [Syzygium oleosum]|uniref:probable LRR receptor-like serine/threonine-protein kinase At4g29180 n=1 Tax=Syzygium oleosum TaxID=219896 RepID=UPI0024B8D7CC|nr:probable LRR receptor-like serine/threonine-protein kinase At4g29180 [Syzygium oleosum]